MKSKRSSYRFRCPGEAIEYKTAYSEGTAELVDISTDGCALQMVTCPVILDEKVLISITLTDATVLEMQGRIVRKEEGGFGVRFSLIEEETKLRLRNYFAEKARQKKLNMTAI